MSAIEKIRTQILTTYVAVWAAGLVAFLLATV